MNPSKLQKYLLINYLIGFASYFSYSVFIVNSLSVLALPPESDIPEEVLATEIITQGRSSLNNQSLSAAEYATQREDESNSIFPPDVNPELKHTVFLLKVLKMLRTFVPIK